MSPVAASPAPADGKGPRETPGRTAGLPPGPSPGSPLAAQPAAPRQPVAAGDAPTANAPTPAPPRTGKVQFSIKPWGEIVVDGRPRGISPPVKELSIPAGRHRIEIRNGTFPGYASEVDIKPGGNLSITHSFKSQ
jgi:hypothetical protein